jgi:hypothetical protein
MSISEEDIGGIGRAIYKEKILRILDETADKGKVVVIDVHSGDFEVADDVYPDDDLNADERLRSRRPDAVTWVERVGYPTVYRMPSIHIPDISEWPRLD